jgi:hypothetical protein
MVGHPSKRERENRTDRVRAATSAAPTTAEPVFPASNPDRHPPSTKAELALWRAFLAAEIEAILCDKD